MAEAKAKKGNLKFNAVDLITCVVFAALVRVLFLVFKMAGVVFPFNHSFMQMFSTFCFTACCAVVKKKWTCFYYTIGWVAIDFFLQGEHWLYWIYAFVGSLIVEFIMDAVGKSKLPDDPTDVYNSNWMYIFGFIYMCFYFWFTFWMIFNVFLVPCEVWMMLVAFLGAVVLSLLGTKLGLAVGIQGHKLTSN